MVFSSATWDCGWDILVKQNILKTVNLALIPQLVPNSVGWWSQMQCSMSAEKIKCPKPDESLLIYRHLDVSVIDILSNSDMLYPKDILVQPKYQPVYEVTTSLWSRKIKPKVSATKCNLT